MTKSREPSQQRGADRRQAMLDAVIRLLARDGARGVTHRAVAAEAGTAHGAARYYFATREEMLAEALAGIIARQVAEMQAVFRPGSSRDRWAVLAAYLAKRLVKERDGELARYELFLDAARSPRLQRALKAWGGTYVDLLTGELRRGGAKNPLPDAHTLLNLINGLMLQQLAVPRPSFEKGVLLPAIRSFVRAR